MGREMGSRGGELSWRGEGGKEETRKQRRTVNEQATCEAKKNLCF